jgi:hypothetical protein
MHFHHLVWPDGQIFAIHHKVQGVEIRRLLFAGWAATLLPSWTIPLVLASGLVRPKCRLWRGNGELWYLRGT